MSADAITDLITVTMPAHAVLESLENLDCREATWDVAGDLRAQLGAILTPDQLADWLCPAGTAGNHAEFLCTDDNWERPVPTVDEVADDILDEAGIDRWPPDVRATVRAIIVERAEPEVAMFRRTVDANETDWVRRLVEQRGRAWVLEAAAGDTTDHAAS